jgi:uncharacterized membrane protein
MVWLLIGLALWCGAHGFKRIAPAGLAALEARMGPKGAKGAIAATIGLGLVFMIIGVQGAEFVPVYSPPGWTVHLNNLLMLGAVALFGVGHSKGRARTWFRNPMLLGVATWAVAHLLVNGDLISIVLFGVLGIWAVVTIAVIDARDEAWARPPAGPLRSDLILVAITLVTFGVIAAIHTWLGYWPFPR